MNKDKMKLDELKEIAKNITKEELIKDYKEYKKIRNKRGYDIYLTEENKSMELDEAIRICEDFINENKSRPIILHTAIATVLQALKEQNEEIVKYQIYLTEKVIPTKKIEDKLYELGNMKIITLTQRNTIFFAMDILQELLEDK